MLACMDAPIAFETCARYVKKVSFTRIRRGTTSKRICLGNMKASASPLSRPHDPQLRPFTVRVRDRRFRVAIRRVQSIDTNNADSHDTATVAISPNVRCGIR